jgi:hypothetical protein
VGDPVNENRIIGKRERETFFCNLKVVIKVFHSTAGGKLLAVHYRKRKLRVPLAWRGLQEQG